jgi:nicotinic acid phosphoribosyltransferase
MTNNIEKLFKLADTISDTNLRNKYLEILRDSIAEKMCLDKYHLTMAHTSFLEGTACEPATYEMIIRKNPFGGAYTVSAGLGAFRMATRLRIFKRHNTMAGKLQESRRHTNILQRFLRILGQPKIICDN